MRNTNKWIISIWVFLALCFTTVAPLFAGGDDDDGGGDDNGFDFSFAGGFTAVPIFWPDFDFHRGRGLVQLPGTTLPLVLPIAQDAQQQQQLATTQALEAVVDAKRPFRHVSGKPALDEYNGRNVVHLDHGSVDNPFMVYDHGLFHLGLLLGGAVVEPHSMVQFNLLSKWQVTKGNWAHRYAENYEAARKMKWGKTPKKVSDFEEWEIGDWMRKNGIVGLTLYGGVGWMTADARLGGMIKGIWSRTIQKIGETLIRVSFTREKEGGPIARAQAVPMQKTETKFVANSEDTRVYLFDLTKDEDREGLEALLDKHMLPAKGFAEDLAEDGKATLLTNRQVKRKRNTHTPFSFGIPFLFRARWTYHNDRSVAVITNHRNDTDTTITSKAYLHQKMHRHVNAPKKHKGKKWKYFMHTHQHFNRSYAGIVVAKSNPGDKETIASRERHLDVQISFSHDNAKVKKVNKYAAEISQRIGLHDVLIDTDYKTDARIGYVEIVYKLKVGDDALRHIIEANTTQEHMFNERAHDLIDDYFYGLKDPHNICASSHDRLQRRCIRHTRADTIKSLKKIEKYLLKLYKDDVEESEKKSARYLAKIAKELSTNHFVLQTFVLALPPKEHGYGKLEIFGEQFLAQRLAVDPNVKHDNVIDADEPIDDDDTLIFDWDRLNAAEEDLDIY